MKKSSAIDANALFAGVDEMPTGLDEDFEKERAERLQAQQQKELDTSWDITESLKSMPLALKIHVGIAFIMTTVLFIVFRYVAVPTPSEALPWWLFPWFFFATTLLAHYFFANKDYWKGSAIIVFVVTIGLYLLNKTLTPEFDWYLIPLAVASMVGLTLYLLIAKAPVIKIATYLYFIVSALFLVLWINLQLLWTRFPWFVYPILTLGLALCFWYMWQTFRIRKWYWYSVVAGMNLTLQAIFTWAFIAPSENSWPWWLIVLGFFVVISLVLLIYVEGFFCCPLLDEPQGGRTGGGAVVVTQTEAPPQQQSSFLGGLMSSALESMMKR